MSASTITYVGTLVPETCWCGIHFAVPTELSRMFNENGTSIYCPLGHSVVRKKSEAQKLREELQRERDYAARLVAERDQADASLRATKGVVTRMKRRASAGVCPCCNRTFENLHRHMATKHPDYAAVEA